jgi:hypothetical protein
MEKHLNGLIIFALLAAAGCPAIVTAVMFPGGHEAGPIVTEPNLTISGTDFKNSTIPAKYQASPIPVRVEVTISDTLIPGPKGEMEAGPRTIGFSADPVSLLFLVVLIIAGAAGVWYLVKRKPSEAEEEKDEENGE